MAKKATNSAMTVDTRPRPAAKRVSLKMLAEHLGLAQATVSMALNPAAASSSGISQATRERIERAARELDYRPSYFARYLSMGKSYTIGILVPEIGEGYYSSVIAGIEEELMRHNFYYIVSSHRWNPELLQTLPEVFLRRGAEGLIVINTQFDHPMTIPVLTIGSLHTSEHLNVQIDEVRGTFLGLEHLASLQHRNIAFFRGDPDSTATEARWSGIESAAKELELSINPRLIVQLKNRAQAVAPTDFSDGYNAAKALLARRTSFSALFAYNDLSAIGAMRAFQDAGLRVPEDISVLGFDDIPSAQFERPALTTIRQPLHRIGHLAASALLRRIDNPKALSKQILVEPSLVVRGTTAPARTHAIPGPKRRSTRSKTS